MTEDRDNHFPVVTEGTIGAASVQTVNGRDLHAFLESRDDFSSWAKSQIERARLLENRDFVTFQENSGKGRPRTEYAFTLDAAKHIGMMSGTDRGFEVREYFISCERKAMEGPSVAAALNDPATLRTLLLANTEKVLELQGQVQEMKPQVEAFERIAVSDGSLCITDTAKTLQIRPKDLFMFLRSHGWIYKRTGTDHDVAYQSKIVAGLLEHKTNTVTRTDGTEKTVTQVRVTPRGLSVLAKLLPPAVSEAA